MKESGPFHSDFWTVGSSVTLVCQKIWPKTGWSHFLFNKPC